ncbi:MAG: right-handed parallel beta-helix repeat-containing protein [Rikenellaceae bacterium]
MKRRVLLLASALVLTIGASYGAKQSSAGGVKELATEFASQFSEENNTIKYKPTAKYKRTIYIDAVGGNDKADGSKKSPIKSLTQLSKMGIKSGDQILLKGGSSYPGTVELKELRNIMVGSYGDAKATIDGKGYPNGVLIQSCQNVVVCDVKITCNGGPKNATKMIRPQDSKVNARTGVLLRTGKDLPMSNITLYNVDIKDIYFFNVDDSEIPHDERPCRKWGIKHSNYFGWGIKGEAKGALVKNLTIEDCHIKGTSRTAIQLNGNIKNSPFEDMTIKDCSIIEVGGPGIMFSGLKNGLITKTRTYRTGHSQDPRMWGRGSGSWLVSSDKVLYDRNIFERAEGIGDCCGAHIDIGNKNVVIQYCLSKDNAGGFVEILGKNENCSYRYNISIDDGWRNPKSDPLQVEFWKVKKEVADSKALFQDNAAGSLGCVLTVNGHAGKHYIGPYNSYVYNNTVVCSNPRKDNFKNPFVFQIATTAEGVMMMNNIFWVPEPFVKGWSVHQYSNGEFHSKAYDFRVPTGELINGKKPVVRDMNAEELAKSAVTIKNNLYQLYDPKFPDAKNALPNGNAPKDNHNLYLDKNALGGNPNFAKSEGWERAEDLIPSNKELINKGMKIEKLPNDKTSYGVFPQLEMEYDFFGRKITSPIVGACVPQ